MDISREKSELIIESGNLRLPISNYGTGIHELIILITAVLSIENSICCIEEPEIHLRPRLQRELIEFLIKDTNNQYIISSHSPTLINAGDTNEDVQIFHLQLSKGVTIGGPVLSESGNLAVIRDLGIKASDLLQSNCIIWVEGPSDQVYIKRWLELLAPNIREGRDFIFLCYSQLPKLEIGRDNLANNFINALKLNQNMILVADSDKHSKNDASRINEYKASLIRSCEENGGISWVTQGKEIENYLTSRVIKAACKSLRGKDIEINWSLYSDFGQAVDKVLRKAGIEPLNYDRDKKGYSKKFAECFQLEDFSTDLKKQVDIIIEKINEWNT